MMTVLANLNGFSYSVLLLIAILIIKSLISHFITHDPLRFFRFFRFYCHQLAKKVNKPKNSTKQQSVAGLIAAFITLVPIIIIIWLFEVFIEVAYLWQGLMLYIALGSLGLNDINKKLAQALVAKQTYLAKEILSPWVLRNTGNLSSLGLSKAAIEMQLLRTLQQMYVVSFIFLLAGPLSALAYRLLLEMHYCWNNKSPSFAYFGLYIQKIINLCQWLPVRLFSLLLLITTLGQNSLLFWRLSKKYIFQFNNSIAISLFALTLEVRLGGVAIYEKNKLRKESFNDLAKQPEPADIIHANKKLNKLMWISLLTISCFATLSACIPT